jgi:phenylacetate-CoA ligase
MFDRLPEVRQLVQTWLVSEADEIKQEQFRRLQACWREAVENVPYYQELVATGKAPMRFASFEEFRSSVPVLSREELIRKADLFKRRKPANQVLMTAGSTGQPLRFGSSNNEAIYHTAINQWAGRLINGVDLGDKVFLLWGHSHLLGTGLKGRWNNQIRRWKDAVAGYRRVDAYHLGSHVAIKYLAELRKFRPKAVIGYSCALDMLARFNLAGGASAADSGVQLCIACAEDFPREDSRKILENFFECKVIMEYGGVDFGVVAYELLNQSCYRTFWNSHFVEIEGQDSSSGPLIVSNLTPRYFPLFRYRNGDECYCPEVTEWGHVLTFKGIKGRINDVLSLPDGSRIHSVGLFHCIHQEPVFSIQLVVRNSNFRIRLAAPTLPRDCEKRIRERLRDLHPVLENCPLDIVPDVGTNLAGKRRWITYE